MSHFLLVRLTFVRGLSLFFLLGGLFSQSLLLAGPGAKVRSQTFPFSASHRHTALSRPPLSRLIRRLWWRIIVLFMYNTCFNGTYNVSEGLVLVKALSEVKGEISRQHRLADTVRGLMKRVGGTGEAGSLLYSIMCIYNGSVSRHRERCRSEYIGRT